jgi:hypothetical protein
MDPLEQHRGGHIRSGSCEFGLNRHPRLAKQCENSAD